jgi:hypothetical protein
MNTRVAPLGLLGLSLPVAGVAAARAQAPETVFALRHCQRTHTWQSAYVRGIVPETVDLSRDAQVQEILEDGRPFITAHCTPPSRPNTRHPLRWWGVNATLSGIYQLNGHPGPHSAEGAALDARASRDANPRGDADPIRSASFPTAVNNVLTRFAW